MGQVMGEKGEGVGRHRQWDSVREGLSKKDRSSFRHVATPERPKRAGHLAASR